MSNSPPAIGAPSISTCFSSRCQPRGRTSSTACSSCGFSAYCLPFSAVNARSPCTAPISARWPVSRFCQVGEVESSKSAMNTFAPEFSALMTIFGSTGPVISTRRSCRAVGTGATVQSPSRMARVSSRKSGRPPASKKAWRSRRAASRAWRAGSIARCSETSSASAPGGSRASCPTRLVVRAMPGVGRSARASRGGRAKAVADMGNS